MTKGRQKVNLPSFCTRNTFVTRVGVWLWQSMKRGYSFVFYTVTEAVAAVIAGILIAVCTKKADGVTYVYLFLGMIANPRYDGFLGLLGWIVSVIMASAALFCGIGLTLILFLPFMGTCCVPSINKGGTS